MTRAGRWSCAALLGVLAAGTVAAEDGRLAAVVRSAREAQQQGRESDLGPLVAEHRDLAYDAVDELLASGDPDDARLAASMGAAFERAFDEDCVRRRVATVRGLDAKAHRRWLEGKAAKDEAFAAFADGRLEEADAMFAELAELFLELGDVKETASALSSRGTVAVVLGESRLGLERLDAARTEALRACDRVLVGVIALSRAYAQDDLGQTDEAIASLEETIRIARQAEDVRLELRALGNLGATYDRVGRLDEAREVHRRSAALATEIGDAEGAANAWFNLGVLDGRADDLEGQRAHWLRALQTAEDMGLDLFAGEIHLSLARAARETGDWAASRDHLDRARTRLSDAAPPQLLARLELGEAQHLLALGNQADALPYLDRAEQRLDGLDARALAISVAEGRAVALYYLGDYSGSESALRKALDEALASGQPGAEADCRANLGFMLFQSGHATEGLEQLERAFSLHRELGRTGWSQDLELIGYLRFRSGDPTGARVAFEASIDGARKHQDPITELEALTDLARVELSEGGTRRPEARRRLAEARAIAARLDEPMGLLSVGLLEAEAAIDDRDADTARAALDRAASAMARTSQHEEAWRRHHLLGRLAELEGETARAIEAYRNAIESVERRRDRMKLAVGRAATLDDRIAPYRRLADLLRKTGRVEASWSVARAGKARTFVEGLLPPYEDLVRDQVVQSMLAGASFSPTRAASDPLATLPDADEASVAGSTLRSLLRPGERLLDLYVDDASLHAYLVDRDRVVVRELALSAAVADLVAAARWPGRPSEEDRAITTAWRHAVRRLGEELIGPLAEDLRGVERLLIVPHGTLHDLPFAALDLDGQPLVSRFDVAVLPAAETLLSRLRTPAGSGFVAFGDPPIEPRLPGAAREVRTLARRVEGGRAWVGDDASEARFRSAAPNAERIHVAAHGRVDPLVPAHSRILLAAGDGQDGRLQADEVAAMRFEASLVVLSGCKTAVESDLARANGPADERIGLPRAFLMAGAGSVVAGLWELDDEAARASMSAIYDGLDGNDAARAVSSLQRRIVAGADDPRLDGLTHPYYWAGLVAYGAGFREPVVPRR